MKCSLLILSSFIDKELDPRKRGEVEAHVVGCQRCARGLAHLREEVDRVGALARVRVVDDSAVALMQQVGLIDEHSAAPARTNASVSVLPEEPLPPWLSGEVGQALPWNAVRPNRNAPVPVPASPGEVRDRAPANQEEGEATTPGSPVLPATTPQDSQSSDLLEVIDAVGPEAYVMEHQDTDTDNRPSQQQSSSALAEFENIPLRSEGPMDQPELFFAEIPRESSPGPDEVEDATRLELRASAAPTRRVGQGLPPAAEPAGPSDLETEPRGYEPIAESPGTAPIELAAPAPAPPVSSPIGEVEIPRPEPWYPPGTSPEALHSPSRLVLPPQEASRSRQHFADPVSPPALPVAPYGVDAPQRPLRQQGALLAGPASLWGRLREAVAVRRAIARAGHAEDFDDSVELVAGVPSGRPRIPEPEMVENWTPSTENRSSSPAFPTAREWSSPLPQSVSDPHDDDLEPRWTRPAANPTEGAIPLASSVEPASPEIQRWTPPTPESRQNRIPQAEPGHVDMDLSHDQNSSVPVAAFPTDALRSGDHDSSPFASLRAEALRNERTRAPLRSASGSRVAAARAMGAASIAGQRSKDAVAALRQRLPGLGHRMSPALALAGRDRRLTMVGAAVLALLLGGLALGHSSTPSTSSTASTSTTPVAPPANSGAGTAQQPAPQPSAAAPQASATAIQIADPHFLGTGGAGFAVQDIRFGIHPGDFRVVFDLSGGSGSPKTVVGLRDPQTLDVIFDSMSPGGTGQLPNTSTITSVTILPRTPQGQTVYEFKLAKPLTVNQYFTTGPLRLVLDLT